MLGFNGGLIGAARNTTLNPSVPGVWTLEEQLKAKRAGLWAANAGEDLYFGNVSLLLRGNGTNGSTTFVDDSSSNLSPTVVGSVSISTAQSKFGGSSIYISGPGSRLSYAASALHVFGSNDFTIEGWLYVVGGQNYARMLHYGPAWNDNNAWGIAAKNADFPGKLAFFAYKLGGVLCVSTTSIVSNTWYHVAVTRSSGVFRLFINGIIEATNSSHVGVAIESATTNGLGIGSSFTGQTGGEDLTGHIDDLRITKGVARYTSNFTPPGAL